MTGTDVEAPGASPLATASAIGWLCAAFVLGAGLRLYLLADQILLDDEWHGIRVILGQGYLESLLTVDPLANSSPPYNLYRVWIQNHFQLSEFALRLPALAAGLATLVALPALFARSVGRRATLLYAFLLAISPFLVFYSRFSRPYSLVALVGCVAFVSFWSWLEHHRTRDAVAYFATGVAAIWLHPLAAITIFTPLLIALCRWLTARTRVLGPADPRPQPSLGSLVGLGTGLAVASAFLLVPAIATHDMLPWASRSLTGHAAFESILMMSGTGTPWIGVAFAALAAAGFVVLVRATPLFALMIAATSLAHLLALLIAQPEGSDVAIVVVRYGMPLFPIALLLVAIGLDRASQAAGTHLTRAQPRAAGVLGFALALGFVALLLWAGPFREIYAAPNSFTAHSAFQGSYAPIDWRQADARHVFPGHPMRAEDVSPFYHQVAAQPDVHTLVEYPVDITNYNNLLYFYQRIHGKRVLAGYSRSKNVHGFHMDGISEDTAIPEVALINLDLVLSEAPEPEKLGFRNMVDLTTLQPVRESGADLIIFQKKINVLTLLEEGHGRVELNYQSSSIYISALRKRGKAPIYEDDQIAVFRVADL